jgi:hypothetical protein
VIRQGDLFSAMDSHLSDISRVIQLAVAPVFLLTAISTLISAMNGRLARIVDRRRVLLGRLALNQTDVGDEYLACTDELKVLEARSRLVYFAIFFSVLSALLVCLVVAFAFIGALMTTDLARAVAGLFVLSMAAMIAALGLFLREIYFAVRTGTHTNR